MKPLSKLIVSQSFGARPEYYSKFGLKGHEGVDFQTKNLGNSWWNDFMGYQPCYAIRDGICTAHYGHKYYGTYIDLVDKDGNLFKYCHLKNAVPPSADSTIPSKDLVYRVRAGQIIGVTGKSGNTSGPHLHLMYRPANYNTNNGYFGYEDPMKLFTEKFTFKCAVITTKRNQEIDEAAKFIDTKLKEFSSGLLGFEIVQWVDMNIKDPTPCTNFLTDEFVPLLDNLNIPIKDEVDYVYVMYSGSKQNELWTLTPLWDQIWPVPFTLMPDSWPANNLKDSFLFEVGHGLIQCYNYRRGSLPSIQNEDNYSGGEDYVRRKVQSILPYLDLYNQPVG